MERKEKEEEKAGGEKDKAVEFRSMRDIGCRDGRVLIKEHVRDKHVQERNKGFERWGGVRIRCEVEHL